MRKGGEKRRRKRRRGGWARGAGFTLLLPPPPPPPPPRSPPSSLPSLRLARKAARRPISEWSAQLPIKRRRPLRSAPRAVCVCGYREASHFSRRVEGFDGGTLPACGPHHCALQSTRTHTHAHKARTHVTASAKSWMHTPERERAHARELF